MTDRPRAPAARGGVDSDPRRAGHGVELENVSARPPPRPGSNDHAGRVVNEAMTQRGYSSLECQIAKRSAQYGEHGSFLTYERMAQLCTTRNGRHPHRESVGRATRKIARDRVMIHRRIPPGVTPPGADGPTGHGTTSNRPNYKALGLRRPTWRGERTREAQQRRKQERSCRSRSLPTCDRSSAVLAAVGLTLPPPPSAAARTSPPPRGSNWIDVAMAERAGLAPPPPRPPIESWARLELDALIDELDGTTIVDEQSRGPPDGGA